MKEDCECDIQRLHPESNIKENQQNLIILCEMAIGKVCNSVGYVKNCKILCSQTNIKLTIETKIKMLTFVVTKTKQFLY